jgi:hypothetical protein
MREERAMKKLKLVIASNTFSRKKISGNYSFHHSIPA